jgi:hypothetical protein
LLRFQPAEATVAKQRGENNIFFSLLYHKSRRSERRRIKFFRGAYFLKIALQFLKNMRLLKIYYGGDSRRMTYDTATKTTLTSQKSSLPGQQNH